MTTPTTAADPTADDAPTEAEIAAVTDGELRALFADYGDEEAAAEIAAITDADLRGLFDAEQLRRAGISPTLAEGDA